MERQEHAHEWAKRRNEPTMAKGAELSVDARKNRAGLKWHLNSNGRIDCPMHRDLRPQRTTPIPLNDIWACTRPGNHLQTFGGGGKLSLVLLLGSVFSGGTETLTTGLRNTHGLKTSNCGWIRPVKTETLGHGKKNYLLNLRKDDF